MVQITKVKKYLKLSAKSSGLQEILPFLKYLLLFTEWVSFLEVLSCLAAPSGGNLDFYTECFDWNLLHLSQAHTLLADLEDPQIELHLLWSCLGVCKSLTCYVVPLKTICNIFFWYDTILRASLDHLWCGLSDSVWYQATLLFRLGGLGLCDSVNTIGWCNDVSSLSCSLLNVPSIVSLVCALQPLKGQIIHLCNMIFKHSLILISLTQ